MIIIKKILIMKKQLKLFMNVVKIINGIWMKQYV